MFSPNIYPCPFIDRDDFREPLDDESKKIFSFFKATNRYSLLESVHKHVRSTTGRTFPKHIIGSNFPANSTARARIITAIIRVPPRPSTKVSKIVENSLHRVLATVIILTYEVRLGLG